MNPICVEFPDTELEEGEIVQPASCKVEDQTEPVIASQGGIEVPKESRLIIESKIINEQDNNIVTKLDLISEKCFNPKNSLKTHKLVNSEVTKADNPCTRTACDFKAITNYLLFKHIKEVHQGLRYDCEFCEKCFPNKKKFTDHQAIHTGEKPYACSQCDYCSSMAYNLKMHQMIHSNIKPFMCLICDLSFKHKNYLKQHRHVHSEKNKFKFACNNTIYTSHTTCSFVATSRPRLFQHIKEAHQGVRYTCELCTFHSDCKQLLTRHISKDHDGLNYTCNTCDFNTASKDAAYMHTQVKHQGLKFCCNTCKRQFETPEGLARHKRKKHETAILLCDKCNFKSLSESLTKRHKALNHDTKPQFSCNICNKQFETSQRVAGHKRKQHDSAILLCDKCDFKSFSDSLTKRHKALKHHETKPQDILQYFKQCDYTSESEKNLENM